MHWKSLMQSSSGNIFLRFLGSICFSSKWHFFFDFSFSGQHFGMKMMFRLRSSYLSWGLGGRCNKENHFLDAQQPHAILLQRVIDYSLKQTRGYNSSLICCRRRRNHNLHFHTLISQVYQFQTTIIWVTCSTS